MNEYVFIILQWVNFSVPVVTYREKIKKNKLEKINNIENFDKNIYIKNKNTASLYSSVKIYRANHIFIYFYFVFFIFQDNFNISVFMYLTKSNPKFL